MKVYVVAKSDVAVLKGQWEAVYVYFWQADRSVEGKADLFAYEVEVSVTGDVKKVA